MINNEMIPREYMLEFEEKTRTDPLLRDIPLSFFEFLNAMAY
jgi:hypothetical protein